MLTKKSFWFVAGAVSALVFSLVRLPASVAVAQQGKQPFASSIEQRQETVEQLRKLNGLMQKQIDLLTSGKVRVVVVEPAPGGKPDGKAR